jgi:hypothetical protein
LSGASPCAREVRRRVLCSLEHEEIRRERVVERDRGRGVQPERAAGDRPESVEDRTVGRRVVGGDGTGAVPRKGEVPRKRRGRGIEPRPEATIVVSARDRRVELLQYYYHA